MVPMKRRSCFAKTARPEIKKVHPRKRLFSSLDAHDNPVSWVTGPPGSGKTTLVSSYLLERKHAHIWYQFDERDVDVAHFYYYLRNAVQEVFPRKRNLLPHFSQEYLPQMAFFNLRYFEKLFSLLIIHKPFKIVFDNYQAVPDNSIIHELIVQGLDMMPDGIQLIMISREEPPSAFARARANSKVGFLRWNDLRLTFDESHAIMVLKSREPIGGDILTLFHEEAQGWAAGLILLLEQSGSQMIEPQKLKPLSNLSREAVFDYLAGEFLAKVSPEVQKFLVKSAFLPNLKIEAVRKLTGLHDAERILSDLSRRNYFTEKLLATEPTYEYHPLLRDFLLSSKSKYLSTEEIRDVQQRAADLLDETGATEEAAALLIEIEDWTRLSSLIQKNANKLVAQGQTQTLASWLSGFPEDFMNSSPWLLFWNGTCVMPFNPVEGKPLLEKAFSLFENQNEHAGQLLAWSGIIECFEFACSNFTPLDRWISVMENFIECHPHFPSHDLEIRVVSKLFSAMTFRQPHHPMLQKWEARMNYLLPLIGEGQLRLMIGSSLVLRASWIGDTKKAEWLIDLLRPPSTREIPPLSMLFWLSLEAICKWITGDLQGCLSTIEKGFDTSRESGVHLMDYFLYSQGIYATLSAGDLKAANTLMNQLKAAINPDRLYDVSHYHFMAGWEAMLHDDAAQAFEHVQHALEISKAIGVPFAQALGHLGVAQALIARNEHENARNHIEAAHRIGKGMGSNILEFMVWLTLAKLAMEKGDEAECLEALTASMTLGRVHNLMLFPWWLPRIMARLCAKALEARIEVDYVKKLIRERNLQPESLSLRLEQWPWMIKCYTFGGFELLRDEKPMPFSRKAQEKPLSILKVLLATEGGVRSENISDLLWPDADGDSAYHSFKVTLHRLRSLIGYPEAIQTIQGHIILNSSYCWVDAWEFTKCLDEAERLWKSGDPAVAARLTEKAVALYRGPFLGKDGEEPWALRTIERLRNRFLRSVCNLGEYWSSIGQWEKALGCYQKGFDVDDLAEGFCQELMRCYQRLDQKAEALVLYRNFEKRLKLILGVDPSRKIKALKEDLLRKT
jgi:LuxR family transcriptional regulator, maltose regulon positive regulatory protein